MKNTLDYIADAIHNLQHLANQPRANSTDNLTTLDQITRDLTTATESYEAENTLTAKIESLIGIHGWATALEALYNHASAKLDNTNARAALLTHLAQAEETANINDL